MLQYSTLLGMSRAKTVEVRGNVGLVFVSLQETKPRNEADTPLFSSGGACRFVREKEGEKRGSGNREAGAGREGGGLYDYELLNLGIIMGPGFSETLRPFTVLYRPCAHSHFFTRTAMRSVIGKTC